jgi:hypothetical protein
VKNGAVSWCNSQFICRQGSGRTSSFIAKIRNKVFAHFHAVAIKCRSSMRNWLFGLPKRILCEQSPWHQGKLLACSWLCSSPVSPISGSQWVWTSRFKHSCTSHDFFPELLSNHFKSLRHTFPRFAQNLMDTRCRIHRKISSGQIRLEIKGYVDHHVQPAAWNFVYWPPRYANSIICRCISLLQLLYRWQHRFRKLWIAVVYCS